MSCAGYDNNCICANCVDADQNKEEATGTDITTLGSSLAERANLRAEVERLKEEHGRACETIAAMHAAAVGEVRGSVRGVVEDVADLRADNQRLRGIVSKQEIGNRALRLSLRNVLTLTRKLRKAKSLDRTSADHLIRFCAEAGVTPSILRAEDT